MTRSVTAGFLTSDAIAGYSLSGGRSAPAAKPAAAGRKPAAAAPPAKKAAAAPAAAASEGVKVTQIRKGDGVTYPAPGDVLTMQYVGKLRANKKVTRSVMGRSLIE